MASDNFMEQLLNKAAETVEEDNLTIDIPPVRNNKNEETGHLKVGIFPEGKKSTGKGMSFEEVYEKLGINDDTPMTPELSIQVQKMHFGFETDEEVLAYHARLQERIEKTFIELEKVFHEQMLEKGIDPQSLTLKDFSDWIKSHKSDKQKAEDALAISKPLYYNPTLSENYHYATEKIMKEIFLKGAPVTNTLSTDSKKDDVYITYELKLEDGYEISSPLEPIDRDLIEAIGNLLKNSNTNCLKLVTIYRELTHNPKATMTEKIEENLLQMLRRCASKRLLLDVSKEAKYSEKKTEWKSLKNKIYFDEQVLNWRAAKGKSIGFSDDDMYIEFLTYPVLLRYAEAKGNVRTIESKILNVKGLKNTNENIVIRNYLSREIKWMKTGKRTRRVSGETVLNNAISFDTVLEYAGISDVKGVERQRKKDVIEKILNYWTDCKWIDGFTTDKASRTSPVKGFTIKLSKKTMDS